MSIELLKQRLKVELGMESSRLCTISVYGTDFTFGEPLYKHLAALRHWIDVPHVYRKLSVYVYAVDGEMIEPKDYLRRYTLCRQLRCIPPIIANYIGQRLEELMPFVDYKKIPECKDLFDMFAEVDPPPHTEELFLRAISTIRARLWHDRFRLLKKALGVLTTSEDLASQFQESFFIDPNNPHMTPQQPKSRAVEIPLALVIKPELEKLLRSRIHVDTTQDYVPKGLYDDKDLNKAPPVDMTHLTRDDFLNMFWQSAKGRHKAEPVNVVPIDTIPVMSPDATD